MCTAIQAITRSEDGVPRSGRVVQRSASETLVPRASGIICNCRVLPRNRASEKMRINLANAIDVRRHVGMAEACARKSAAPLLRSQKARIRPNFWICLDICKTIQNLKHQLGIDGLIIVRPYAFADYQPTIGRQSRARFTQAKQEILGDMHHINGIYDIKFSGSNSLSVPRQINV